MTQARPKPPSLDIVNESATGSPILDLSSVLILHLGFVGDTLVVALDANLPLFVYGDAALASGRVRADAFTDYGYHARTLDPAGVVFGPVVRPNARAQVLALAERLHGHFDRYSQYPSSLFFTGLMKELELLVGFDEVFAAIAGYASARRITLNDVCVVIAPDEALYTLPLAYLGAAEGEPLLTRVGGVANVLSLLALKWAIKDYHWTTRANLSAGAPRAVVAAANPGRLFPHLDLQRELQAVSAAFEQDNCMLLGTAVTQAAFGDAYSAGDICWFSGHGCWDAAHGIEVSGTMLPFPRSGPVFMDDVLTNWHFLFTSDWNFQLLWLTVMNCCVLGRSVLVGPNPLGFVSALHSVGSIGTIAALWPVEDSAAIEFGGALAAQIVQHYHGTSFPRARALRDTVRQLFNGDRGRLWRLAPYALWGVP